ncbi:MAG: carbon monoxide dehydrogenase subunit G [Gammaproteobacteria bacterium]|nr:carbon monoxide dehydrogenase subunit G [Gammaproteobacteria bacterium]
MGKLEQLGEYLIRAPRERVWEALNDPAVLRQCIEGCQRFDRIEDNRYATEVKARVGPVSATFKGTVSLVDALPPESYGLELAVNSGAAGFGKGTASVTLTETPEGTLLAYTAAGNVGGKLAQIGQRLIDVAARKTADGFFETFAGIVVAQACEDLAGSPVETDAAKPDGDVEAPAVSNAWRTRLAWGAGLALLLIAAFILL